MSGLLLFCIFFSAALSLLSYVYCWQDIKGGEPHIVSLRQITAVMDRNKLIALFGQPRAGYRFHFDAELLASFMRRYQLHYWREIATDMTCLLGAWYYLRQAESAALLWFALLASACQVINVLYSVWLIRTWGWQIREEMEEGE